MNWYRLCCWYNTLSVLGTGQDGLPRPVGGNSTDRALTGSVAHLPPPHAALHHRLGFDSSRKYAAAVVTADEGDIRETITLLKGAPERLLPFIRDAMGSDGHPIPWSRSRMNAILRHHTGKGERVLVLAVSRQALPADALSRGEFGSLTFLCAVTLSDQLRPEAGEAVHTLHEAGIQVVMITGDSRGMWHSLWELRPDSHRGGACRSLRSPS